MASSKMVTSKDIEEIKRQKEIERAVAQGNTSVNCLHDSRICFVKI